jgi:hypothetical protein
MIYNLTLHDKHAIFVTNDGLKVLVDTGVPYTFFNQKLWNFEGTNYSTQTLLSGITVDAVSELVGTEVNVLLGTDIMSKFKICLDYHNLTISFEPLAYIIDEGEKIQVQMYMGYMLLPVTINGQNVMGFLDTGAKLSYITEELINGLDANPERVKDFYIGIGEFETRTYTTEATLSSGYSFQGTFGGDLPAQVTRQFLSGERKAIIGSDFFFSSKKVWIDYANSYIYIIK